MLNISFRKISHMLKNTNGKSSIAFSSHALSTHVILNGNGPSYLCWTMLRGVESE